MVGGGVAEEGSLQKVEVEIEGRISSVRRLVVGSEGGCWSRMGCRIGRVDSVWSREGTFEPMRKQLTSHIEWWWLMDAQISGDKLFASAVDHLELIFFSLTFSFCWRMEQFRCSDIQFPSHPQGSQGCAGHGCWRWNSGQKPLSMKAGNHSNAARARYYF